MKHRALELHATLRGDLPPADLASLKRAVRAHYDALLVAQAESELVAADLGELLCVRLEELLDGVATLTPTHRASVIGAARYFVADDDVVPDSHALTGLDDDVFVFNTVAREIGRGDLVIDE